MGLRYCVDEDTTLFCEGTLLRRRTQRQKRMILRWVILQNAAAEGLLRGRGHYTLQRAYCADEGTTLFAETTLLRKRIVLLRVGLRGATLRIRSGEDYGMLQPKVYFADEGTTLC